MIKEIRPVIGLWVVSMLMATPAMGQMTVSLGTDRMKMAAAKCMANAYRGRKTGRCFCKKGYRMNTAKTRCYKKRAMPKRPAMPRPAPRGSY